MGKGENKVVVKQEVGKVEIKQEDCEFELFPEIKIESSIHGNSIQIKEEPPDETVQESIGINSCNYLELKSDPNLLNLFKEEDAEDYISPVLGIDSASEEVFIVPNSGSDSTIHHCSSHLPSVTSRNGIIQHKVLPTDSDESEDSSDSSEDEMEDDSTKEFVYHKQWKYEIEIVHEDTGEIRENFKCGTCQAEYNHKRNVIAHIRQHHELRSRYQCDVCSRSFKDEEKLQDHFCESYIEVRPKEYRRTKEVSPGKFVYGDKWHFHISGDFFICDTCSEKRKLKPHMTSHISRQHADHGRILCGNCPKSFSTVKSLKLHQAVHVKAEQKAMQRPTPTEKCAVKQKVKYKKKDPILDSIMFAILRNKSSQDS